MSRTVKPRFSESFRRLCQVAAITGTSRTYEVVDGLLPVAMVYGDGPWRGTEDWAIAINRLFGLDVPAADIFMSIQRLMASEDLLFDARSDAYSLAPSAAEAVHQRIAAGDSLERNAQASWLAEVEAGIGDLTNLTLWSCLLTYTGKALARHGAEAVEILGGSAPADGDDEPIGNDASATRLLLESMREVGVDASRYDDVAAAVAVFFDGKNTDRVRYITELTNSTFNFLALNIDEEVRDALLKSLPELTVFLDSNVIYGLVGAHSQPMSAASRDLIEAIVANGFPFKVYYHEKTLAELERTIEAVGARLTRHQWSPAVSKGLLAAPHLMSSIEVKYHEQNVETPTPPSIFLSRYSNLPGLLGSLGLTIYRPSPLEESSSVDRRRHELIAEYEEFAKKNASPSRRRDRSYEALDHDMTIWLAASHRRKPRGKAPLFVGALVLSADYLLRKFDRTVLTKDYGSGIPTVVMPDALLQALRPFVASSPENFEKTFVQIFATTEFRGLTPAMADARFNVAGYLATFADLPEETAIRILANSMLMNRVRTFREGSDELRAAVDAALVEENESLILERDTARSEAQRAYLVTQRAASSAELRAQDLNRMLEQGDYAGAETAIASVLEQLATIKGLSPSNVQINFGGQTMVGGYYHNQDSQIAAQGPSAHAEHVTQQKANWTIDVDAEQLVDELERLRAFLVDRAQAADQYETIADVVAARDAVAAGDQPKALARLKKAGTWALSSAREIGISIAAETIKKAMGL
jgi:hypothetical protein